MKLWKIALLCVCAPLAAQVQLGRNVQIGAGGTGGGCSTGGIPTTNGSVTGDSSSTNCGTDNRSGDTASVPANVQTFGHDAGTGNKATEAVLIGDTPGANLNPVSGSDHDLIGIGDFVLDCNLFFCNEGIAIGDSVANLTAGSNFIGLGNGSLSNSFVTNTIGMGQGAAATTAGDQPATTADVIALGNGAVFLDSSTTPGDPIISFLHDVIGVGNGAGSHIQGNSHDILGLGDGAGANYATGTHDVVAMGDGAGSGVFGSKPTLADIVALGDNVCPHLGTGSSDVFCLGHGITPASLGAVVNNAIGIGSGITLGSNQTIIGNSSTTSLKLFGCPTGQTALNDGSGTCYTPGAGSGTVTGSGTTGYLPLWTGSTALGNSNIDDGVTTASTVTVHEPVTISDPSHPSQLTLTYNVSHAPTGLAGSAVYAPDTSGNATFNENNTGFSRVCTAANGQCSGGTPFISSLTTTGSSGAATVTSGVLNIPVYSGASPLTTKGDLFGHSTVDARIPVGSDGQVLTADSTQTLGVKWAAGAGGASFPSTNGIVFNTSTSASRVATGDTDYPSVISTPSESSIHPLAIQANSIFDQNCNNRFTDGTPYCTAGPAYASLGEFIDDQMLACMKSAAKCSTTLLLTTLNKWDAAFNVNKGYPITVPNNPGAVTNNDFCSSYDNNCRVGYTTGVATGDGRIMVPETLYMYCQKVGLGSSACTTQYTALVPHIKAAWALVPRDATTHLYQVIPNSEYVCGTAFQEYMRLTGFVAGCNVWAAIDDANMLALATAANDATNVTFFTNDLAQLVAGIRANLIDGTSGLLLAATIQNNANLDVPSSSLAVACDSSPVMAPCGILTSGQKTTIDNYFNTNYSTLVNAAGYVLQTPRVLGWAVIGTIPSSGAPPYTGSGTNSTTYQGGFWSFHNDWFATALGAVNQAQVGTLLNTFLNGVDPGCEYFNQGSATCNGTTPNLESPQWAVATNIVYPLAPAYTAGVGCFNKYGALTTATSCTSGGALIYGTNNITTASTPVIFSGSTTNNQLLKLTSANTANTALFIENTSTGGKNWAPVVEGSGSSVPGAFSFFDATDSVTPLRLLATGTNSTGLETFKNPGHTSVAIGSGTPIDLGSDAYLTTIGNASNGGAGVLVSRNASSSDYSSIDLITAGNTSTGWSMQMRPGGADWYLFDRVANAAMLQATHGTTNTLTVGGSLVTQSVVAVGTGTPWASTAFSGSMGSNNGSADGGPWRGYYAANHNLAFNVSNSGVPGTCGTTEIIRFVKDMGETGGAVIGGIDNSGLLCGWAGVNLPSGMVYKWNGDTGLSRDSAGVVDVGNGTAGNTSGTLKAAVGTFSGAVTGTTLTPIYNTSGTLQASAHQVFGSGTLSGGTLAVTLSGSSVYSSSSTYVCSANDSTSASAIEVTYTSGTSVTFTGTGTDTFRYQCVGN